MDLEDELITSEEFERFRKIILLKSGNRETNCYKEKYTCQLARKDEKKGQFGFRNCSH